MRAGCAGSQPGRLPHNCHSRRGFHKGVQFRPRGATESHNRQMANTSPDNSLGGFRLLRKLGVGSRADVFLGATETGAVVLKVFRAGVAAQSIGTELDALGRLGSTHLVRLLDVTSGDDDRPILVLDRVRRGSVAALVRDRDSLECGEVVTILAPLADTLPGLHRLGIGHARICAQNVHLGSSGEPVLLGFGHCELFGRDESVAAIDAEPAAAADRDALASLAVALLSRIRGAATDRRVIELIEWIDSAPREFEFPERLESRLFDLADPLPIDFGRTQPESSVVPARLGLEARVLPAPAPARSPEEAAQVEPARNVLVWLDAALRDNPIDAVKSRVLAALKGVRKRFWIAATAVVLVFVVAVALLPQNSPSPTAMPTASPTPSAPLSTSTPLPHDPVLALPVLLSERNRCIRDLSVLCLDGVDDQSSGAYADDAALIQQLQEGAETPKSASITAPAPSLTEQLGDSVILSLGLGRSATGGPASVLMIENQNGWRIRGYLTGVQATGSPSPTN